MKGEKRMSSRNPIMEMMAISTRAGSRIPPSEYDIRRLRELWDSELKDIEDVDCWIPIRLVTMLEVFLRHWVERLVDFGAPYVERASKLKLDLKFDFAIVTSVHGKLVSLGQIVGHSVPASRFDAIVG